MKSWFSVTPLFAVLWLAGNFANAQEPGPLKLWPGTPPGNAANLPAEKWEKKRVTHVSEPTLTVFRPEKEKSAGVAVLVCPGGGYQALMMTTRGRMWRGGSIRWGLPGSC